MYLSRFELSEYADNDAARALYSKFDYEGRFRDYAKKVNSLSMVLLRATPKAS